MNYDLETIRSQFPALALTDKGQPRVYLDNPAGTQVPVQVIQRMSDYLIHCNACLLYTSPSPRDGLLSRMPSSA